MKKPSECSSFPLHSAVGVFLGNLILSFLIFSSFFHGMMAMPNLYLPTMRIMIFAIGGFLLSWLLFIHLFSSLGLFSGLFGMIFSPLFIWTMGSVPLVLSPIFREVLHNAPQSWISSVHSMRITSFLFLIMLDTSFLPASFAIPMAWGEVIIAFFAVFVIHSFSVNNRHARKIALIWNIFCLFESFSTMGLELFILPSFQSNRISIGLPVRYLNSTIFPYQRFTIPILMVMNGYSLWKIVTEKEKVAMIWHEEEEDNLHLADISRTQSSVFRLSFKKTPLFEMVGFDST